MATRAPAGPPLVLPAVSYAGLTVAAIALAASAPLPGVSATEYFEYVSTHRDQLRLSSFLFFAAGLPLAIWTAIAYRRVRGLAGNPPGAPIALVGGVLAASAAMLTGLLGWTVSRTDDAAIASALRDLGFAVGGVGFVAGMGLLFVGVAVSMLRLDLARPTAVAGIALGVVAAVAQFSLIFEPLGLALPIARFGGIIWLIVVSLQLPVRGQTVAA